MTRVYRMFHGMDSERTNLAATLVFGDDGLCQWVSHEDAFATFFPGQIYILTLDAIARTLNSYAFVPVDEDDPEYVAALDAARAFVPEGEIGIHAMAAAADFVKAVWEVRKDVTIVPAGMLADWLRRTPDQLRGDKELPEHIEAAADALEGLPSAVLYNAVPDHYDGSSAAFLQDAEHVLRSATRRLQRLSRGTSG